MFSMEKPLEGEKSDHIVFSSRPFQIVEFLK